MGLGAEITKKFFLVGECKEAVKELLGKPVEGALTQFKSFGKNISYVPGYHCLVAAPPTSGKSFFVLSEVVNLAKRDNAKVMLFTPEMGDSPQIIALLLHMYTGKTIYARDGIERLEGKELEDAQRWLNNHFIIIDTEDNMTIKDIYDQVDLFNETYKTHINYLICDNINDLDEEIGKFGGRQDLAIENLMTRVRRYNKKRKMYTFLVTHSANQGLPLLKNGIKYYNPIDPNLARGGLASYRKAYLFLTVHRPAFGLEDENGVPYKENEAHVICLKAKPEGSGVKGSLSKIFYDWRTASYYTEDSPAQSNFRPLTSEEQSDGDVPEVNY